MLGSYRLPEYKLQFIDLLTGVMLGVVAVFVLLLHTYISKLIAKTADLIKNPYVLGACGGGLVGLIAYALPLTATAGSKQLGLELEISETMGVGLIAAILIGK
jgi:H+/Cl- antiporter ClcA